MKSIAAFFARLKLRFIWSWNGVRDAWVEQHSFRSWVWANAVSAALAFALPLTGGERALILALGVLLAGIVFLVFFFDTGGTAVDTGHPRLDATISQMAAASSAA